MIYRLNLNCIVQYCENYQDCRRVQQLAYFGEVFDTRQCGEQCDVCRKGTYYEKHDVTAYAKSICEMVQVKLCSGETMAAFSPLIACMHIRAL